MEESPDRRASGSRATARRPLHRALVAVVAVGGVLALAACGGSDPVETGRGETQPPEELGAQIPFPILPANVAAAGSALIAVEATRVFEGDEEFNVVRRNIRAASRSVDGQWHELPSLPYRGVASIATAGDTVVSAGLECLRDVCDEGRVVLYVLNSDRTSWNRVEVPETEKVQTASAELTTSLSPSNYAVLTGGGSTQYWVGPDGVASDASPRRDLGGDRRFSCILDDKIVSMAAQGATTPGGDPDTFTSWEMIGDVHIQDNVPPEFAEHTGAAIPPGITTMDSLICGAGLVTVVDQTTQGTYSLESDAWELGPSNFVELGGDPTFRSTPGRFAAAADGTTVFAATDDGLVLTRVGNQPWEDTGLYAGMIYSSDTQVIGFDINTGTTIELWRG